MDHAATVLETASGSLPLPTFLPDATRGVTRAVDGEDLRGAGIDACVVNVFHLARTPGVKSIAAMGGMHAFMGWQGPLLSDSGGFQIYSALRGAPSRGSITKRGFTYKDPDTGKKTILTPAKAIQLQFRLGTDVIVTLDHCTHPDAPAEEQRTSVDHTLHWAEIGRETHRHLVEETGRSPLLFAVVQGGADPALRRECGERLLEMGFDGYGYGGWPVDDAGSLLDAVGLVAEMMPDKTPLWGLGIGSPAGIVAAARMGYSVFDCTLPTRDARHGRLTVLHRELDPATLDAPDLTGHVYVRDVDHRRSDEPVDARCDCHCCSRYSRGYLHHLFRIKDPLSLRLATIHNLTVYARIVKALRTDAG